MSQHFQASLFEDEEAPPPISEKEDYGVPKLDDYDRFLVFFSGGKDSLACVLHLLEMGVSPSRIELHHHLIDGKEGSDLMDWPVTDAYCKAVADALGTTYLTSWREGGFEKEMTRTDEPTAKIYFPSDDDKSYTSLGGNGPNGTRNKFPQVSANLSVRWCSSYLKIDVGSRYISNHKKFIDGKTLVLTGERAEESSARAKYKSFEPHRADLRNGIRVKRYVDHWRPIHSWSEEEVWKIIEKYKVMPHPAYYLGWGRTSCRQCIFGSANQWATIKSIAPIAFSKIAMYEKQFGLTIHRTEDVSRRAQKGVAYKVNPFWVGVSSQKTFDLPIIVQDWVLPAGAFGESCGPT